MRARRHKAAGDLALPSLPDTVAQLVCFTVLTRTRAGRTRTTQIRLLTTLLDPGLFPAGELSKTDRPKPPPRRSFTPRGRPNPAVAPCRRRWGPEPPR